MRHIALINILGILAALPSTDGQTPPVSEHTVAAKRPTPPTRDPRGPGFARATDLPDGAIPPSDEDGNCILGPTHGVAPELTQQDGVPHGSVFVFTMTSAESKIYPVIALDAGTLGTPDPNEPAKLFVTTSNPAPYSRKVEVDVPKQYVHGQPAPFIVGMDGSDRALLTYSTT